MVGLAGYLALLDHLHNVHNMMEERELAIWKGIADSLRTPVIDHRIWKPECEKCNMWDKLEDTGCFLQRCKLTGESTWID